MPESVSVALPPIVTVPAPPRMPAIVWAVVLFATSAVARSSPVVLVIAPDVKVTVPAVSLKPPSESVPPVRVMSPGRAFATSTMIVPTERAVPPVKSLAPLSVMLPAVFLVSAPSPLSLAEIVPLVATTWVGAMVPPVRVPPATVTVLAMVLALRLSVPPLSAIALDPKAALSPAVSVPRVMVVVPE